jgi:hypothetical protein
MRRDLLAARDELRQYEGHVASLRLEKGSLQVQQTTPTSPPCTHAHTSNERVVGRLRTKGEVHSG